MEDDLPQFLILPLVQPDQDDEINTDKIRELTSNGLDHTEPEDRCVAWLVLLDIYPHFARKWPSVLEELVSLYEAYVECCKIKDWENKHFNIYINDNEIFNLPNNTMMGQIHSDLVRTRRNIIILPIEEPDDGQPKGSFSHFETHLRRLERILYILGNVNQNIQYMQGFNELIMPFYYTLYCAKSLFKNEFVIEALTFHCLHQLLSYTELKDLFTTDDKSSIILSKLNDFDNILSSHCSLAHKVINDEFHIPHTNYCFRWFVLMFSQEFEMEVLQQVWDALFTHFDDLVNFEFYIGCAKVELVQNDLIGKDYAETLELLQNIEIPNINQLLNKANEWWKKDHDPSLINVVAFKVSSAVKGLFTKLTKE